MRSVSKSSAYPDTVQPGIPKLPDLPPVGWRRTKFGDHLFEEKRPVSLQNDEAYDLVTVKRARGGVVKRDTKLGSDISVKTQFEVKAEDFLISKRQIVHGACGLVPAELDGSTVSNEYAVLRGKKSIDLEYLKHFSHSVFFQQTCFHSSIGVHIEKMIFKTDKWFDWKFDLPPIHEQQRITQLLSTWDRAIETTEKLIANSQAQKKALMQQLLTGKKRLPGFDGEWREYRLDQLAIVTMGSSPKSENYNENGVGLPLLQGNADIVDGRSKPRAFTSEVTQVCEPGDILLSVRAPVGSIAVSGHRACIGRGLAAIKAKNNISQSLLLEHLRGAESHWLKLSQGSTFEAINSKDVKSMRFALPVAPKEQEAIAAVLLSAQKEVEARTSMLRSLYEEKSALMQQLLTGRRRVKTEEAAA